MYKEIEKSIIKITKNDYYNEIKENSNQIINAVE